MNAETTAAFICADGSNYLLAFELSTTLLPLYPDP